MKVSDNEKKAFVSSLSQIAKGSGIVFLGFLCYSVFLLLSNIIIARFWGQTNFGIFSLAFSLLSIIAVISCVGIDRGITRNIAYYHGRKTINAIPCLIYSSIVITFFTSIIAGIGLFILSEPISLQLFNIPSLSTPLKIFSFTLPLFNLLTILSSVFRGYHNIKPLVYFQHVSLSVLFAVLLIPLLIANFPFISVFYAYLVSTAFSLLFILIYIKKYSKIASLRISELRYNTVKNLLLFSLPLVGTAILQRIIRWTDTLMIGGLQTAALVGLYNAARPLSLFLTFPLSALLMMYTPVISSMYGANQHKNMQQSYTIITRWLAFLTLPLFLLFFLFPEKLLLFFFGGSYIAAAATLQILSIGAILHNLTGPNGAYLLALGKSRFILYASLATAMINIGLNFALIPRYGIEGAAVASSVSIVTVNVIKCYYLYRIHHAHPVDKTMIIPTVLSITFSALIFLLINRFIIVSIWLIPLFLILFYGFVFISLLLTKNLKKEDVQMISIFAKKYHMNSTKIELFLNKYIK